MFRASRAGTAERNPRHEVSGRCSAQDMNIPLKIELYGMVVLIADSTGHHRPMSPGQIDDWVAVGLNCETKLAEQYKCSVVAWTVNPIAEGQGTKT